MSIKAIDQLIDQTWDQFCSDPHPRIQQLLKDAEVFEKREYIAISILATIWSDLMIASEAVQNLREQLKKG